MIEWIQDNIAQYGLTTIAFVGLAVLFFAKRVVKLAILFSLLAATFGAGFLVAASQA